MQNGKGVKEREGDDFYPQQRHHRHRVMLGTVSEMPGLGQFAESVVFDLPTQVPQIPGSVLI